MPRKTRDLEALNNSLRAQALNNSLRALKTIIGERQAAFLLKKEKQRQDPDVKISPAEALMEVLEKAMESLAKFHQLCQEQKISSEQHMRLDRLALPLIGFIEGNSG